VVSDVANQFTATCDRTEECRSEGPIVWSHVLSKLLRRKLPPLPADAAVLMAVDADVHLKHQSPAAGHGGGRAPAAEAAPRLVGQAPAEDEDEEEVDEEIDAEPAPQQPRGGQNNRQQQAPPPPPPNLVEVMAAQTQLVQRLAEGAEHRNNGGNHHGPPEEDLQRKIERFICLKAPTFSYSEDPTDADDWLRVTETKLDLTNCTDEECVALAIHQLEGPAKSWWDSCCDSQQDPAHITWDEFAKAFREQHVP
jgi:hypothetical protein